VAPESQTDARAAHSVHRLERSSSRAEKTGQAAQARRDETGQKKLIFPDAPYFWPLPLSCTASFRWSAVTTTSVAASTVSSAVLMVTSWFKGSAAF